jgi:phage gp36-like protein
MTAKKQRLTLLEKIVKEAVDQTTLERVATELQSFKDKFNNPNQLSEAIYKFFMVALSNFEEVQKELERSSNLEYEASTDARAAIYTHLEYIVSALHLPFLIECGKMILQKKEFSSKVNRRVLDATNTIVQKLSNLYKHFLSVAPKVTSQFKSAIAQLQQSKTVSPETVKKLINNLNAIIEIVKKGDKYRQVIAYKAASKVVQELQQK